MCAPAHATADPNPASIRGERGAWPLYRQWTPAEVEHFSTWIENIFVLKSTGTTDQRLAKLERVLTDPEMNLLLDEDFRGSPSNPQLDRASMRAMHSIIDCGKLTIALTGYYAYRRGLPWMATHIRSGDGIDVRISSFNVPSGTVSCRDYDSPGRFLTDAVYGFCTGNYRIEPDGPNAELSDTVPVAIDPDHLMPGSLYYLDGHVMIVGHIDLFGEVYFLDATISKTRDLYTHNCLSAASGLTPMNAGERPLSGCYRGFRIHRFPIADTDEDGNVLRVRRRTDAEMAHFGYSLEQYAKAAELHEQGVIDAEGVGLPGIQEFIRYRLRSADYMNLTGVLEKHADRMLEFCKAREEIVQTAWADVQELGPIVFPEDLPGQNVFNAHGRWRAHSTMLQDMQARQRYFHLINWLDDVRVWFESTPGFVDFGEWTDAGIAGPADLAHIAINEKNRVFGARSFTYTNSAGKEVRLTLLDVERRMYRLSFDPNHPPELRWGALPGSREAKDAPQMDSVLPDGSRLDMAEAYRRQVYYRTIAHRETDESFLRHMFTEGFPILKPFDEHFSKWKRLYPSPPLIPVYPQPREVDRLAKKIEIP
jgi:hypothetical protein